MKPCYLFDIDGTLADCSHRLGHITGGKTDWRAFFAACGDDAPIQHIADGARPMTSPYTNYNSRKLRFLEGRR